MATDPVRRPIDARQQEWAKAMARGLAESGILPNHISMASVVFATLAGVAFIRAACLPDSRWFWLLAAAGGIQLRLLCNLFDGMVAVEGGKRTKSGEIFNELPDRLSDTVILVAAGIAIGTDTGLELGWAAAFSAMATAYVRLLGGTAGAPQYFFGPMAKQHRMAVMTTAALLTMVESWVTHEQGRVLTLALSIVTVGSVITAMRRTRRIVQDLEAKPDAP